MTDKTLIKVLADMARKEKKVRELKGRLRIKGSIVAKGTTKKGNIRIGVRRGTDIYNCIVIRSHKGRYALAEKMQGGNLVSFEGIPRFRYVLCTKLKQIYALDKSTQVTLRKA